MSFPVENASFIEVVTELEIPEQRFERIAEFAANLGLIRGVADSLKYEIVLGRYNVLDQINDDGRNVRADDAHHVAEPFSTARLIAGLFEVFDGREMSAGIDMAKTLTNEGGGLSVRFLLNDVALEAVQSIKDLTSDAVGRRKMKEHGEFADESVAVRLGWVDARAAPTARRKYLGADAGRARNQGKGSKAFRPAKVARQLAGSADNRKAIHRLFADETKLSTPEVRFGSVSEDTFALEGLSDGRIGVATERSLAVRTISLADIVLVDHIDEDVASEVATLGGLDDSYAWAKHIEPVSPSLLPTAEQRWLLRRDH